jgi:hypothetical protein
MTLWFDKHGRPVDVLEWGRLSEDWDYCLIVEDEAHGWIVRTVWTGDPGIHGVILGSSRPLPIFATVAIQHAGTPDARILELWLHVNLEQAQQGHRRIVDWMRRPGLIPLICDTYIAELFLVSRAKPEPPVNR